MDNSDNALFRSSPCADCGGQMLWTQNAWKVGEVGQAAYRCPNGHVLDPGATRQCPHCGLHDTTVITEQDGRQQLGCNRCSERFEFPR
jgi:hypothetical protein